MTSKSPSRSSIARSRARKIARDRKNLLDLAREAIQRRDDHAVDDVVTLLRLADSLDVR